MSIEIGFVGVERGEGVGFVLVLKGLYDVGRFLEDVVILGK